jgi:hypothetical protein
MALLLALLPSPLLGPAAWQPAAERLRRRGWRVSVVRGPTHPTRARDVLDAFAADLPETDETVLVPHSNAGLFAPALSRRRDVTAHVFVDAALPPASGTTPLAPPALYEHLRTLADESGVLPPWTRWWPEADVQALFPDDASRVNVEAGQPRMPLRYFRDRVDVGPGWTSTPSAYVAFGDTYADERRRAEEWGWPTVVLDGAHLHMLVAPDAVAAAVHALLTRLGCRPG